MKLKFRKIQVTFVFIMLFQNSYSQLNTKEQIELFNFLPQPITTLYCSDLSFDVVQKQLFLDSRIYSQSKDLLKDGKTILLQFRIADRYYHIFQTENNYMGLFIKIFFDNIDDLKRFGYLYSTYFQMNDSGSSEDPKQIKYYARSDMPLFTLIMKFDEETGMYIASIMPTCVKL